MTPWRLLPTEEQWNKMKDVCGASCAFVVCHRLQDDNLIGKAGFLPENWPALGWLGWLQLICTWLMWRYLTTNHYNTMMSLHTHTVFFYLFSHFLPTLLSYMLTAKVTSREWKFWNLSFIIFSFIFRHLLLWKLYQLKKEFLPVTEVIWPMRLHAAWKCLIMFVLCSVTAPLEVRLWVTVSPSAGTRSSSALTTSSWPVWTAGAAASRVKGYCTKFTRDWELLMFRTRLQQWSMLSHPFYFTFYFLFLYFEIKNSKYVQIPWTRAL